MADDMADAAVPAATDPSVTFIARRDDDLGADADDLMAVYAAAYGQDAEEVRGRGDIVRRHAAYPDALGVLALVDDRLVGFCYGTRTRDGHWWHEHVGAAMSDEQRERWLRDAFVIHELAVIPEARGRGIGEQLVRRVLDQPEVLRRRAVLLSSPESNPVDRLHRRLGFVDVLEAVPLGPDGPAYRVMGKRRDDD